LSFIVTSREDSYGVSMTCETMANAILVC